MRRLFDEYSIWAALQQAQYACEPRDKVLVPVKAGSNPSGGTQIIHKWKNILGQHEVTTHMVLDADGWPVHWDEKDLLLRATKYIHSKVKD